MSRVIKFRAWDTKSMHFGGFSVHATGKTDLQGFTFQNAADLLTIMQFTGLTDKNGVDIYEGDIVTGSYSNLDVDYSTSSAVEWGYTSDSDGWSCGSTLGWVVSEGSSLQDLVDYKGCEVIGNIYENPELIK